MAAAANNVEATTYPQLPESDNNWPDQVLRFKEKVNIREFGSNNIPGLTYYAPTTHNRLAAGPKQYYVHPRFLPDLKGKRSKIVPKNPLTSAKVGASGMERQAGFPAYTLPAGSTRRNNAWSAELNASVSAARASAENKPARPRTMKNAHALAKMHHNAWQTENNAEQSALKFAKVKSEALAALNASRKMRAESVKANAEKALAAARALREANTGAGKSRRRRSRRSSRKARKTRRQRK